MHIEAVIVRIWRWPRRPWVGDLGGRNCPSVEIHSEAEIDISNNSSVYQKHPGVPDGSDGSDWTSCPLMDVYTFPVAQATGRDSHCIHSSPSVYLTDVAAFRCSWEHLGAGWITVDQSGKNIFGNAAGAPGNHTYYLSFNDFQNLCIQFVFSSMYLWIYIATYLHTEYLDWQHAVIESDWKCAWRWPSSELRDTLWRCDRASLGRQLGTEIEWTQRCTGRRWSIEFGDALRDRDRVNSEMHWEAVIHWVWTFTWRPRSSELWDVFWAVIERV